MDANSILRPDKTQTPFISYAYAILTFFQHYLKHHPKGDYAQPYAQYIKSIITLWGDSHGPVFLLNSLQAMLAFNTFTDYVV